MTYVEECIDRWDSNIYPYGIHPCLGFRGEKSNYEYEYVTVEDLIHLTLTHDDLSLLCQRALCLCARNLTNHLNCVKIF